MFFPAVISVGVLWHNLLTAGNNLQQSHLTTNAAAAVHSRHRKMHRKSKQHSQIPNKVTQRWFKRITQQFSSNLNKKKSSKSEKNNCEGFIQMLNWNWSHSLEHQYRLQVSDSSLQIYLVKSQGNTLNSKMWILNSTIHSLTNLVCFFLRNESKYKVHFSQYIPLRFSVHQRCSISPYPKLTRTHKYSRCNPQNVNLE